MKIIITYTKTNTRIVVVIVVNLLLANVVVKCEVSLWYTAFST